MKSGIFATSWNSTPIYAYETGTEGAFRRLSDQIADKARKEPSGSVRVHFDNTYDFGDVAFSHGHSQVYGDFDGIALRQGDMVSIDGESIFHFHNSFTDPIDLREFAASLKATPSRLWYLLRRAVATTGLTSFPPAYSSNVDPEDVSSIFRFVSEIGGTRYEIIEDWTASFRAKILIDSSISEYFVK